MFNPQPRALHFKPAIPSHSHTRSLARFQSRIFNLQLYKFAIAIVCAERVCVRAVFALCATSNLISRAKECEYIHTILLLSRYFRETFFCPFPPLHLKNTAQICKRRL